jgi:RHS repeat-associated protein
MNDAGTVRYLLGDHLGSTSITADTAGARVAELLYKAWGENRYAFSTTPTTLRFTGQRQESGLGGADGLYYYGARWYDPYLNRWLQPDTIVPNPGNPQDLNRFAYVRNNPLRYIDPSGHDPLDAEWERAFREATGRDPTDKDRQDRLFSLIYKGSGPDGAWTDADWQWYTTHRDDLYRGRENWRSDDQEAGLDRFIEHVGKLATYYTDDERDQFVRGFALLYGGIVYSAGWKSAAAMTAANLRLTGLAEGMEGWDFRYYDSDNFQQDQTHHYAGLFFLGYFGGKVVGRAINQVRDGRPDYHNAGDVDLGKLAVDQGVKFREMSLSQLATDLLPALRPPWKR